jgi:hypothetical protein
LYNANGAVYIAGNEHRAGLFRLAKRNRGCSSEKLGRN